MSAIVDKSSKFPLQLLIIVLDYTYINENAYHH